MCGDTCCSSCGPAQGNFKCTICGEWASEGCEHIDENTGDIKPQYQAEADRIIEAENKMWEQMEKDQEEYEKLRNEQDL